MDDEDLLRVEGAEITARQVRTWLWPLRRQDVVHRESTVIWSAYDEDGDHSFVGLAEMRRG
jgi:hypothetical protein